MFVWGFVKWLGRVTLWLVFLPLGVWRSIRHGRRKRDHELALRIGDELRRGTLEAERELQARRERGEL